MLEKLLIVQVKSLFTEMYQKMLPTFTSANSLNVFVEGSAQMPKQLIKRTKSAKDRRSAHLAEFTWLLH